MCDKAVHLYPSLLEIIPDLLNNEWICEKAIAKHLWLLEYVHDNLKTKEMCEKAVKDEPGPIKFVPDHFDTHFLSFKVVEAAPWRLDDIPDHFKTPKMCNDTVRKGLFYLQYVHGWFVTQEQLKIWDDYNDYWNDNEIIKWYDGYQKRKAQKAQIKKELMPLLGIPIV